MRQQRNREAKELIGSRVDTAKAIFTQNSAASQLSNQKAAPIKPIRNSIAQRINTLNNQQQQQSHSYSYGSPSNTAEEHSKIESIDATLPGPSAIVDDVTEPIDVSSAATTQALHIPDDDDTDSYSTIKRSPYAKTGNTSHVTSPEVEQTAVVPSEPTSVKNGDSSALAATVNNCINDDMHRGERKRYEPTKYAYNNDPIIIYNKCRCCHS